MKKTKKSKKRESFIEDIRRNRGKGTGKQGARDTLCDIILMFFFFS